jgi:hypothetical protein
VGEANYCELSQRKLLLLLFGRQWVLFLLILLLLLIICIRIFRGLVETTGTISPWFHSHQQQEKLRTEEDGNETRNNQGPPAEGGNEKKRETNNFDGGRVLHLLYIFSIDFFLTLNLRNQQGRKRERVDSVDICIGNEKEVCCPAHPRK